MIFTTVSAAAAPSGIDKAIQKAYNFQFDEAEELLASYRSSNPNDIWGNLGQIVYDFLRVKQDPKDENFKKVFDELEAAEERVKELNKRDGAEEDVFSACFISYYSMKCYALKERWIHTATSAVEARKLAVELQESAAFPPEMYFILGEQAYTTSLAPDYLKPLLKGLDFSPDQAEGLEGILQASRTGGLTRYEAGLMYISSCIYVEKDYESALVAAEAFLEEFPGNLSVQFFYIDLLLHTGRLSRAEELMAYYETGQGRREITGKWVPRYIQMKGNMANAGGEYAEAIEFYQESLTFDEISGYTATEINLELGKLLDITGRRKEAIKVYKTCYQGKGFTLQKDEAKALKKNPYTGNRGSY